MIELEASLIQTIAYLEQTESCQRYEASTISSPGFIAADRYINHIRPALRKSASRLLRKMDDAVHECEADYRFE
jgi:hypothetical protein